MKRKIALIIFYFLILNGCTSPPKKPSESESGNGPPPKLLAPNVKKIWIAPIIKDDGNEWEAGHYLYRIERRTQWSR